MNSNHNSYALARLDLNLLQIFSVIYQERNLTRAAERLCISPSAVSHALRRMRGHLGDPLFTREAQGVVPTPLAYRIWPDIQQGLCHLERAITRSESFNPHRDIRRITLAMPDELEPVLLLRLQALIHHQLPDVRIDSVRINRSTLRSDLAAGRIDCAIDVTQPAAEGLAYAPLAQDDWVVVSRRPCVLDTSTYVQAKHVTVSSRRTGMVLEDFALAQQGIERQVMMRCQSYEAASRLVTQSELLLTMPRSLALSINSYLENCLLEVPFWLPEVRLNLYWLSNRSTDPANTWLRELLLTMGIDGWSVRKSSHTV
ncbi:LysR family transcriptional regulator [Pseudomonas sp. GM55]|uniref:LysR family transcriptional regulator n=1 Tax=Pseudomonas sp. GM55 TaxID=1144333 RepID=UPI0002706F99|nr:LysR family transcriptional regulator [Pseudomonas sp. GM55]EJM72782.1 transcriptional regulator [Pseudomonas sp. GM55]